MNIAIIGPAHPLRGGGISTFNERLATALQDAGHTVTIYSFSLQYPSFLFPGKSQFTNEPAPQHLTIKTVVNSINPLNWILVGNQIKKAKHDLVIVRYWIPFMGPCLGTISRRIKKNKHTQIICIADNVIPHEKRPGDVAFTKYFLKPIDSFITMSKSVMEELKTFTSKRIAYTPHPLYDNYGSAVSKEEACQHLQLHPKEKYLLFFGFIRKYKGLDLLLEAMNDERIKSLGVQLIIAGEYYEDQEHCEQLIAQLNNKVVSFTNFIPNEEVKYYFGAADLIVQPYRSATNSGITQVAYHFEKPMIVTDVGGLSEVVPDGRCGFVVAPNPQSIAEGIVHFFQPESISHLSHNLQQEKRKYSWELFVAVLMQLYPSK
jgi:glycosyltransferase involved in cell wall biosynthesis